MIGAPARRKGGQEDPAPRALLEQSVERVLAPPSEPVDPNNLARMSLADLRAQLSSFGTDATGPKSALVRRLQQTMDSRTDVLRVESLWTLCQLAYEHRSLVQALVDRVGLIRNLIGLVDGYWAGTDTGKSVAEAVCAVLHTICSSRQAVEAIARIPGSVVAFARLLDVRNGAVGRLLQDAAGLVHKLAHADSHCRAQLFSFGIITVILRLLAHTPCWCLGNGPKLGISLLAVLEQREHESGERDAGRELSAGPMAAANETVVEECLGTLRNLSEHSVGKAALEGHASEAVGIFVRLVKDRGEFTKQIKFSAHLRDNEFAGYTFERVIIQCLGILHNLLTHSETWREEAIVARTADVLVELLHTANNERVTCDALCVLQCLTFSAVSSQRIVAACGVVPLTEVLVRAQAQFAQVHSVSADKKYAEAQDWTVIVCAALGTLANITFYCPRSHDAGESRGSVDGTNEIISAGAVPVIINLLKLAIAIVEPEPEPEPDLDLSLLLPTLEGTLGLLRNLAFHFTCVPAIAASGAIPVVVKLFEPTRNLELPSAVTEAAIGCLHNLFIFDRARSEMREFQWMVSVLNGWVFLDDRDTLSKTGREAIGCLQFLSLETEMRKTIVESNVVESAIQLTQSGTDRGDYVPAALLLRNLATGGGADTDRARQALVNAGVVELFVDVLMANEVASSSTKDQAIKNRILQQHAIGTLAQVGGHPLCQQHIDTVGATKPIVEHLRVHSENMFGTNDGSNRQSEDVLASSLTLLVKLCDYQPNKAKLSALGVVPILVSIVKLQRRKNKLASTALEILHSLRGDKLASPEWPHVDNSSNLLVESDESDHKILLSLENNETGGRMKRLGMSSAVRRSELGGMLVISEAADSDAESKPSNGLGVHDVDSAHQVTAVAVLSNSRPNSKSAYMLKPVTIMRNGKQFLVERDTVPVARWNVGFACLFLLVLSVTTATAVTLHSEYTIEGYQGTTDAAGDPKDARTEITSPMDVLDSRDESRPWSYSPIGDETQAPLFVVLKCCVIGGFVATVWITLLCRVLALQADRIIPFGLVASCIWWMVCSANSDLGCSLARMAWWVMLGLSAVAAPGARAGRQLAVAFFHVCQLILSSGDPWMLVSVFLVMWFEVLWMVLWVGAFSGVLCLDGDKQADLRGALVVVLCIALYWVHRIFHCVAHVVAASCATAWYRTVPRHSEVKWWRQQLCCLVLGGRKHAPRVAWRALYNASTTSLGSICMASVVAGPVTTLRVLLPQPLPRRHSTSKRKWPGPGADRLFGIKYLPAIPDHPLLGHVWDATVVLYDTLVRCCWHLLDGISNKCNLAALAILPVTGIGPTGPKVSGQYADVATHAWNYANQTGVQPLRQSPLFYWLTVAAGCSGGCVTAGIACSKVSGDFSCDTAQLAVTLSFFVGWFPMATAIAMVDGVASAMLVLAADDPEPLLTKDPRLFAAIVVAMEAAVVKGHLNAPHVTARVQP